MSDWLPGAETHYADLPGLRMHYVTLGPQKGRPALLLHGFPECWYSWRHQMRALADAGFQAIAPDQRGYNLTEKKGPYDLDTLTNDLVDLLDHLGIESCPVVGHDWGGATAWSLAAMHPDRVSRLVTMNGPHPNAYVDACKRGFRQLRRSWYIFFFQLRWIPEYLLRRNDFAAVRRIFDALPDEYMDDADIDRYIEALSRPGALTAAINWYRALPWAMLRHRGSLPNPMISMPTCVIWGENDVALDVLCNDTLPEYVDELEIHYLPRASHWVQIDHPEEVNRLMLGFLKPGRRRGRGH